jgi:hypothetical protein
LPLDKYFRGVEVALLRSGWDHEAMFAGFKAGDNKANHSNLDLGTFVLDAVGVRWAMDLGADDYNLPGYFGNQRWDYYRLRAEGHNTLVINPGSQSDQQPSAAARMIRYDSKPQRAFAIADLTAAYAREARSVQRGLALLERRQVLVQDEVQADKLADVWWFLHTSAEVKLASDGITATLSQGTNRLWARILSPVNAAFITMAAEPLPSSPQPAKQARNAKVRKLAIHLREITDARLAVLLVPLRPGEPASTKLPNLIPLARW